MFIFESWPDVEIHSRQTCCGCEFAAQQRGNQALQLKEVGTTVTMFA